MPDIPLKIDNECFKIVDNRIDAVLSGTMSVKTFVLLITPDDPFILLGDTVYVLTPVEYYASRPGTIDDATYDLIFYMMLDLEDVSMLSVPDAMLLSAIKEQIPTCPTCQLKTHKHTIHRMVSRYNIPGISDMQITLYTKSYPEHTVMIEPKVKKLMPELYDIAMPNRLSCLDCVSKHVAQASILGNESVMGYPEHLDIARAHLAEAISETPAEATALRNTLEFCLAKTTKDREPFIPIYSLLKLVSEIRANPTIQEQMTEAESTLELSFTDAMKEELTQLSIASLNIVYRNIIAASDFILEYKKVETAEDKALFSGYLATAADTVVSVAPAFANMLRARRLMLKADPVIFKDTEYNFRDIDHYTKGLLNAN